MNEKKLRCFNSEKCADLKELIQSLGPKATEKVFFSLSLIIFHGIKPSNTHRYS